MLNLSLLGTLSLNTSLILYLIVYIPQIIHNRQPNHISQLSIGLHSLLFLSYTFDLLYGYTSHLPWQYKLVSVVSLILIILQHGQLLKWFIQRQQTFLIQANLLFLILNGLLIYYVFMHPVESETVVLFGVIARLCGLLYCIPQIVKNKGKAFGNALSLSYIYLSIILAVLDSISAWCLDWPWPNKLASPISLALMLCLLLQAKKYSLKELSYDI